VKSPKKLLDNGNLNFYIIYTLKAFAQFWSLLIRHSLTGLLGAVPKSELVTLSPAAGNWQAGIPISGCLA
jgi:hypothetical protein